MYIFCVNSLFYVQYRIISSFVLVSNQKMTILKKNKWFNIIFREFTIALRVLPRPEDIRLMVFIRNHQKVYGVYRHIPSRLHYSLGLRARSATSLRPCAPRAGRIDLALRRLYAVYNLQCSNRAGGGTQAEGVPFHFFSYFSAFPFV